MIRTRLSCFDLKQIADSGQCFRILPCKDGYSVVSGHHVLLASQQNCTVTFCCPKEDFPFWEYYFDLNTDYQRIIDSILPEDTYLKRAAAFGSGIRILRQDPWEMIITFVISQQKTIPNIRSLVEALSRRYGTRLLSAPEDMTIYAFPTPEQLLAASLEELLALKLGYRAKYILQITRDVCSGTLDLAALPAMDYAAAKPYLMRFYGIGEKVANCICLFGLHHIDAFPVDTWIKKILLQEYAPKSPELKDLPQSRLFDALIQKHFAAYEGCAGVMQQYIFYYERNRFVQFSANKGPFSAK